MLRENGRERRIDGQDLNFQNLDGQDLDFQNLDFQDLDERTDRQRN